MTTLSDQIAAIDVVAVMDRIVGAAFPQRAAISVSTLDILAMAHRAAALEALAGDLFAAKYEGAAEPADLTARFAALGYETTIKTPGETQ